MSLSDLPALNAGLNSISAICLILGYISIRNGKRELHKKFMLGALFSAVLFLSSYLLYHYTQPVTPFTIPGWPKVVYLSILIPHIILAMGMLPLIFMTFRRGLKGDFERHKKIARWTLPVWLYVSVTGLLVYLMLYQWLPNQ